MSSDGVEAVMGEVDARQGLLPKLRFPEFRDAGAWKLRELSELLTEPKEKNRQLKYGPEHVLSVSGEHGCVNQIAFMGRSYAGASVKEYNVVQTGDIVYTKSPLKACPNGIIKANRGATGIVSVLYAVYRPTASATSDFIDYYFSSDHKLNTYLQPLVKKGPKNSILVNNSDVLKGRIAAPNVVEQQKIADCLSSLDAVIAAEGERLAALREYKKGLMQQLLPRPERIENGEKIPAETTPRLRFPAFKDAGEWERAPLGPRTSKVGSGITPKGGQAAYKNVGRPFMRSQNVGWGELRLEDIAFIDECTHSGFAATEIQADDVLLNITGASIGRSAIADHRIVGGNVSQHVCIIRVDRRALTPGYLNQFLLGQEGQSQIDSFQAGGNRQGLNFDQIRSFQIPMPPELDEQERVADCLLSIDSLLFSADRRISELKAHKSGLMQQLFPSPAEAHA